MTPTHRKILGALTAASYARVTSADDCAQVGFIGHGLIGSERVEELKEPGSLQEQFDLSCAA